MTWTQRVAAAARSLTRGAEAPDAGAGTLPQIESMQSARANHVPLDEALSMSAVYRGFEILETSVMQLSIGTWAGDAAVRTPAFIRRPNLEMSPSVFYAMTAMCMMGNGNAYWLLDRDDAVMAPRKLDILDPARVTVRRGTFGELLYSYNGKLLQAYQVQHLKKLRVAGSEYGLGPIQACKAEIRGALDARNYGAFWFRDAAIPDGILKTEQKLTPEMIAQYQNIWEGLTADGKERPTARRSRIRVLGAGLDYQPQFIKPADAQFLETQGFTVTQIARMLGMPASLMLASVPGNSSTYANVEQDWIGYVRFTLMRYLREIEEAFTGFLPAGRVARFKVDVLLRTDTLTRYKGHQIALEWSDIDEIRAIEGQPPATDEQRANIAARRTKSKETPASDDA